MTRELFRRQAVEQQGERLWGDLILSQPLSFFLMGLFLAGTTVLGVWYLLANDYIRKQTVTGYLSPDRGLVQVTPARGGQLLALNVEQGDRVNEGDLLFEVKVDRRTGSDRLPVSAELLEELARQRNQLRDRIELERRSLAILQQHSRVREAGLLEELERLEAVRRSQKELAGIERRALERAGALHASGLLSNADLDNARGNLLRQNKTVANVELEISRLGASMRENRVKRETRAISAQRKITELRWELSELNKQSVRLQAEKVNKIHAPVGGEVASVNIQAGQPVRANQYIVSLIPRASRLEARLLIPSRAVAFLQSGQSVNIRYDAFPYQKFGLQEATITRVSESAVASPEKGGNNTADEPYYQATAALARQHVRAYGERVALKPGMTLRADVIVEERRLWEWLLDPLLSIRGRL